MAQARRDNLFMGAPFNSVAVANWFVESAEEKPTLMKLLKLVYFAHGWHLALREHSLIDEQIEAWKFGPVVPAVYHAFKDNRLSPIAKPAEIITGFGRSGIEFVTPRLEKDSNLEVFLNRILEVYGKFSAYQLSELTHRPESPWYKVWNEMGGSQRKGTDIPDKLIEEHFKSKLATANA